MYYVYILQSKKNGRYYIGSTNNIERRLSEHKRGKTKSLRHLQPLRLVFQKGYCDETSARTMEQRLKKMKSRVIIEKIIKDGEIKMGL